MRSKAIGALLEEFCCLVLFFILNSYFKFAVNLADTYMYTSFAYVPPKPFSKIQKKIIVRIGGCKLFFVMSWKLRSTLWKQFHCEHAINCAQPSAHNHLFSLKNKKIKFNLDFDRQLQTASLKFHELSFFIYLYLQIKNTFFLSQTPSYRKDDTSVTGKFVSMRFFHRA